MPPRCDNLRDMETPMNQREMILRYHNKCGREWITSLDGTIIPPGLAGRILSEVPASIHLQDGEKFKAVPKGHALVGSEKQLLVEFSRLTPAPLPFQAPQTLDDWKAWLEMLNKKYPGETVELLPHILHAQVFEFGDVKEARLAKENDRATDLHNRGFLKLPYNCVVYRYTGEISGRVHIVALQDGPVLQYGGTTKTTNHFIWPLSLMLNTRGAKIRVEAPSPKLQAKRAAHGKRPLPYVTYVNSEHYYVALDNTEARGHHASPVPHLRRGHLRHLSNGHVIWIKDMLVNCKSIDEILPREKYAVRHA